MFPQVARSQLSQINSKPYAFLTISFGFLLLYSIYDDIVFLQSTNSCRHPHCPPTFYDLGRIILLLRFSVYPSYSWRSPLMLFSTEFLDNSLMPVVAD